MASACGRAGRSRRLASPSLRAPAISHGPPLRLSDDEPRTLAQALARASDAQPARGITFIEADGSEHAISYADLRMAAARIAGGLQRCGVAPGTPAILLLETGRDFLTAFWGAVLARVVPVPASIRHDLRESASGARVVRFWETLARPPHPG